MAKLGEIFFALIGFAVIAFLIQNWWLTLTGGAIFLIWRAIVAWRDTPANREKRAANEAWALYHQVQERLRAGREDEGKDLRLHWLKNIYQTLPDADEDLLNGLLEGAAMLYDEEGFEDGIPTPPARCDSLEGAR